MVIKLKDAKIRINDDEQIITGQYTGGIDVNHIERINECDNTHLLRVLKGETDKNIESEYITITTKYEIPYGCKINDEYSALSAKSVNYYRGELEVNVTAKIVESKHMKDKKFIKLYPKAVLLPNDYADHIQSIWDVFEEE